MEDLALHDKVELDFPHPKMIHFYCLVSKFFVKYMYIYQRGFQNGEDLKQATGGLFPFSALTACVIRAHEV